MKKILSIILCSALIIMMSVLAVSAEVAGDRARNQIDFAKGTAVIDGIKDDCYQAAEKIVTDMPNAGVEGTSFASFEGYVVYDADAVYLWGHISDPTLGLNNGDWNGDSIEVFFNYDLKAGIGASDETETYGPEGCMQFRMCPLPVEDDAGTAHQVITISAGHTYDDEILADTTANPKNYYCAVDADNKGYTIECRFPFPTLKKAEVKTGYAIGFSIQQNDSQDATMTAVGLRTGTIHSVDGEQMEQNWQYAGSMGRAFFTDLQYVAPVVEEAPPAAADEAAPAPEKPAANPKTADNTMIFFGIAAAAIILAGRISKKVKA